VWSALTGDRDLRLAAYHLDFSRKLDAAGSPDWESAHISSVLTIWAFTDSSHNLHKMSSCWYQNDGYSQSLHVHNFVALTHAELQQCASRRQGTFVFLHVVLLYR
jgi:hypothetical protein